MALNALARNRITYIVRGHAWRSRSMSSLAEAKGSLPLEGYRVLDMTRVLAGVSCFFALIWRTALRTTG